MQKIPNYVHIDIFVSRLQKPVNHLNCITFFFILYVCVCFFHFILFLSFFFSHLCILCAIASLLYTIISNSMAFLNGIFLAQSNLCAGMRICILCLLFAVCCVLSVLLKSLRVLYIEYWIVYNIGINHGFSTSS